MANFRVERIFIRVSDYVDFDPNKDLDPVKVADLYHIGSGLIELTMTPYRAHRWFTAAAGLKIVRELIEDLSSSKSAKKSSNAAFLITARQLELQLQKINDSDVKFHLLARDMPTATPIVRNTRNTVHHVRDIPEPDQQISREELRRRITCAFQTHDYVVAMMRKVFEDKELSSYLHVPEFEDIWAELFGVTVESYGAWKWHIRQATVTDTGNGGMRGGRRCVKKLKNGQRCKRLSETGMCNRVHPSAFIHGVTDYCKQHARVMTREEDAKVRAVQEAYSVSRDWIRRDS